MRENVYIAFESDCETSKVVIHSDGRCIIIGEGITRKKAAKAARKTILDSLAEVEKELREIKHGL